MKISPKDVARALIDSLADNPQANVDDACDSAMQLLRRTCPGIPFRMFVKIVEREMKKRGDNTSALLVVPHEHTLKAETIQPLLQAKTGRKVHVERKVDSELIGGAVLLVDHRRIDCSIQGALAALLKTCLQPLD